MALPATGHRKASAGRTRPRIDRAAALIIAAGVGLRLAWALVGGPARRRRDVLPPPRGGPRPWQRRQPPSHGGAYRFLPPGYAGLLAGVFGRIGDSLVMGALLNIVLGGIGLVLTYLLARRFFSVPAARLATGVLAAFPSQVLYVSVLMPDVLSQTLVIAIVWLALVRPDWRRVVLAGALSGALALTAPREMLLLVGILVGWRFVAPWRLCLARAGVMLGVATAVVLPWTVRNAVDGRLCPGLHQCRGELGSATTRTRMAAGWPGTIRGVAGPDLPGGRGRD